MTGRPEGPTRAIHVNWTAPFAVDRALPTSAGPAGRVRYRMPATEVVTMIHSVRAWRRYQGPVDAYTDAVGYEWLVRYGLADLYDHVDKGVIEEMDPALFDPRVYRAIGKIVALAAADEPVALLDLDLYLERPIAGLGGDTFVFAHFETVGNAIYPGRAHLPDPNNVISARWDFRQPATNTAIAYFGSAAHRKAFTRTALAYAQGNSGDVPVHPVARQTFAEQRIAPFLAMRLGIDMRPVCLTTWDPVARRWLGDAPDEAFHHTWREKKRLTRDRAAVGRYLRREMVKLAARYPDERDRLIRLAEQGLFRGLLAPGETAELLGGARHSWQARPA